VTPISLVVDVKRLFSHLVVLTLLGPDLRVVRPMFSVQRAVQIPQP
jgi:hypothetical protein